jgi:hypothetical protein
MDQSLAGQYLTELCLSILHMTERERTELVTRYPRMDKGAACEQLRFAADALARRHDPTYKLIHDWVKESHLVLLMLRCVLEGYDISQTAFDCIIAELQLDNQAQVTVPNAELKVKHSLIKVCTNLIRVLQHTVGNTETSQAIKLVTQADTLAGLICGEDLEWKRAFSDAAMEAQAAYNYVETLYESICVCLHIDAHTYTHRCTQSWSCLCCRRKGEAQMAQI